MMGRSLGNYDVVSQIGEGGMGVVYLARHAMLGRAVAIKVLRQSRPAHDVVARFFNEARAATAVRHPGVVEVYDVGFLEDRTAYIVMEYLDGESLAARIRRGRATVEATLTTFRAGSARWHVLEGDSSLSSLRSAADALCRHGWLDAEACFARLVVLLTPRRGGAFARLVHWIASAHRTLDDGLAARLKTAVAYFTRRRRLLPPVPSGSRPS
jgi:serine/threonine protein kinase